MQKDEQFLFWEEQNEGVGQDHLSFVQLDTSTEKRVSFFGDKDLAERS